MQREVIKPQIDVPVVVRLDQGPEGKEKEGKFGIDYQYTCNHDAAVMWLPKEGRDALLHAGAQAGDEVQICKTMRGRTVLFQAQVVSESNEVEPPPPPARVPSGRGALPPRAYYQPGAAAAQPQPQPPVQQTVQQTARAQAAPAEAAPAVSQHLARCLAAAFDACEMAARYAQSKGGRFDYTEEHICKLGTTIYIGAQKNGGAR